MALLSLAGASGTLSPGFLGEAARAADTAVEQSAPLQAPDQAAAGSPASEGTAGASPAAEPSARVVPGPDGTSANASSTLAPPSKSTSTSTSTSASPSSSVGAAPVGASNASYAALSAHLKAGKVQSLTLPNGLRLLLLEDHSFPVAALVMFYRVGARNEPAGLTGISHVLEHLLFENVGSFRKGELGATIVRNGGQFNGFTSDDFTAFFETVQPSKLPVVMRIEAERMRRGHFGHEDLKEELTKIRATIDEQSKNPQEQMAQEVRATAYMHHPYRNPAIGWKADIDALTVDDVRKYYDRYYYPDNATLVLVGDFKASGALALINKYFAPLPKAPAAIPPVRAVEPVQRAERKVLMHYSGKRDILQLAYHAPSFSSADAPAMVVLEKLLNMQQSGRLKTKLIDAKLASSAHCAFELKRDPGLFTVTFNIPCGSQQKALESWEQLIGQIKSQGVADADLSRAKKQARFALFTERDGPYRAAFDIGFCDSLQSWQAGAALPDKLASVASVDVKRVVQRYFSPNNRVVGLLAGPAPAPPKSAALIDRPAPPVEPVLTFDRLVHNARLVGFKQGDWSLKDVVAQSGETRGARLPNATQPLAPKLGQARNGARPAATGSSISPPSGRPTAAARTLAPSNGSHSPSAPTARAGLRSEATRAVEAPRQVVQKKILSNGMTLLLYESHLSPVVQIHGLLSAGRVFEPSNRHGVADVATACLNNGAQKVSRPQLLQAQEDLGLLPNAMVKFEPGEQFIKFSARCLSQDLVTELNLIGATLKDPSLQDQDVDRARQEVLSSLRQADDSVTLQVDRALLRSLLARGSPYYPADLSERGKIVSQLKSAEVKEFLSQNLTPESATLVLAGDLSMDAAANIAERVFGSWKGSGDHKSKSQSLPSVQANPHRVLKSSIPLKEKNKSFVCLGRLIDLKADSRAYDHLLFADCALTNHPIFSRLAQRIGNEPSIIGDLSPDEIQSRFLPLSRDVVWTLNLPVEPRVVPKAVASVQSELRKFGRSGLTAEEFSEVKRYLIGALPVKQAASDSDVASALADTLQQNLPASTIEELSSRIRQISLDDLNKFIRLQFRPDMASLIVAGSRQTLGTVHNRSQAVGTGAGRVNREEAQPDSNGAGK